MTGTLSVRVRHWQKEGAEKIIEFEGKPNDCQLWRTFINDLREYPWSIASCYIYSLTIG